MNPTRLLAVAGRTLATGAVGAAAYDVARRLTRRVPPHEAAVRGVALGLRGVRRAEHEAEAARLGLADVVAEARERIGEQVAPPGPAAPNHDH